MRLERRNTRANKDDGSGKHLETGTGISPGLPRGKEKEKRPE